MSARVAFDEEKWELEQDRVHLHWGDVLVCRVEKRLQHPTDFPEAQSIAFPMTQPNVVAPYSPRPQQPFLDDEGKAEVKLYEPLAEGPRRLSQVWLGELQSQAQPPTKVIMKAFQEEFMDLPLAREYVFKESRAYHRLEVYQGTRLPYSYGFYYVLLPCGDYVVVHAIEYIETARDTWSRIRALSWLEKEIVATCLVAQIKAFHKMDLIHRDLATRNIFLAESTSSSECAYEFVFIDWAGSHPVPLDYPDVEDYSGYYGLASDFGWLGKDSPLRLWFDARSGTIGADLLATLAFYEDGAAFASTLATPGDCSSFGDGWGTDYAASDDACATSGWGRATSSVSLSTHHDGEA